MIFRCVEGTGAATPASGRGKQSWCSHPHSHTYGKDRAGKRDKVEGGSVPERK